MPITIELTVLISMSCALLGACIGVLTFQRGRRKDADEAARSDGMVMAEIGYIKSGVDDIKRKQAEQDRNHIEVVTRLTAVEASAKQAHHRLDRVEGKE